MPKQPRFQVMANLLFAAVLAATAAVTPAFAQFVITPPSPGCQLLSAPAGTMPALCETFDAPAGTGNRSGDLNGTLWGVSRLIGFVNVGQNMYYDASPTTMQKCGVNVQVLDPNDVAICDGQAVDAVYDQTGVTSLAMYPKQPFDIAGRTGTIAFDVSDDSEGNHTAWPEIWYTDQPVPVPFVHEGSLQEVPRNGFGVRFAYTCAVNSGPGCGARFACPDEPESVAVVSVDSAVVINDYVSNDSFNPPSTINVNQVGCVVASTGPGNMNHFELRVSQNEIDVYGTDAGTTGPIREIATITNAPLTLTRGLVWMEDVHYNGNKFGNEGTHTFTWDNFAFDGPVLARDLAFDVLDALTPVGSGYPGIVNLGWPVTPTDSAPLTLTVSGVNNISQAVGGLLTFNFTDQDVTQVNPPPAPISYRVNNGSWQLQPWPFGNCGTQNGNVSCSSMTIAVPVNLSDVQPGTNTIQFKSTDYVAIANVDLILQGAGGLGCAPNCPATTSTTLASSENPSVVGDSVTFSSTVTSSNGVPPGSVTFSDSGTALGTVSLDAGGNAMFATSSLSAGTHSLTATYSGASGFASSQSQTLLQVVNTAPPPIRFDWEDGGLDGWQKTWGQALALSNSTTQAYTGTHSLKLAVAATETHSAVANETASELTGFNPGTTVTLHVYNQKMTGVAVYPLAFDENWIPNFGIAVPLATGWNTVVYVIPPSFKVVHGIGIQINNPNAESDVLYLDSVTTQ